MVAMVSITQKCVGSILVSQIDAEIIISKVWADFE